MLNDLGMAYSNATGTWFANLMPIAQQLFLWLATIELIWSGIWWALASKREDTVLEPMLRKVVQLLFFYMLLLMAPTWIPMIIGSFAEAGAAASGFDRLDPDTILQQGLSVAWSMHFNIATVLTLGAASLYQLIPSLILVLCFALIAGKVLLTLVESYLVIGGGILMLGFAGSRWTATFSEGFLLYAVRIGVKLFVLYLVVGVGIILPRTWIEEMSLLNYFDIRYHWEMMGGSVIFAMLVQRVPDMAAGMLGARATLHMDRAYQ